MRNAGKSPDTNSLSSLLASSKYPIGISLSGMAINSHPANDRDHDTGHLSVAAVRRSDEVDMRDLNDWCRIISAIQSQLACDSISTE